MFTGIVEEIGTVLSVSGNYRSKKLKIKANIVLESTILGDSIAINGVCQTVIDISCNSFTVDVLNESLIKTNLSSLQSGKKINLERALTLNRPLGGHFVQGHVQGTGIVTNIKTVDKNLYLSLKISPDLNRYIVKEGSITIDGLSLTIASVKQSQIVINIIPHTLKNTTISLLRVGDLVNIEPDILIKATLEKQSVGLTKEKLLSWGY